MNLRQKYKRAKQKLAMYEKEWSKVQVPVFEVHHVETIPLRARYQANDEDRIHPDDAIWELKKVLINGLEPYVEVKSRYDFALMATIYQADITIVDKKGV